MKDKTLYNNKQEEALRSEDVLTGKLTFHSLQPPDLSKCTKDEIKEYFENTYDLTESLFTSLVDTSCFYKCPDKLRLPLIFYYGHTAAVFMNKLVLADLIKPEERINVEFETVFETGVDEMSWDDIENFRMGGEYKWPTVKQVHDYRMQVRQLILKVIERTPLLLPIGWDSPWWAFFMGFEHERIHLETSSVLIRQMPIHMVNMPDAWTYGPFNFESSPPENLFISVEKTKVILGKSYNYPSYGWDNEYGRVEETVLPFEATTFKITNEEYLKFVEAGGYTNSCIDSWTEEGQHWLKSRHANHPIFWICNNGCKSGCGSTLGDYSHCTPDDGSNNFSTKENIHKRPDFPYRLRLMFNVIDMPYNWPVEVNYHEAKAYCNWKGKGFRLITEAEHHALRDLPVFENFQPLTNDTSCDIIYNKCNQINHNLQFGSSTPVNYYPANKKGFHDVFGNVWEWCEDNFNGFPGGQTHYLYHDFSNPCYDGRHNMIMGGSWASTGDEASRFARYMFRRHFFQHCGFRVARSPTSSENNLEKSDPKVRLVQNSVYILGYGVSENPIALDQKLYEIHRYQTENTQYLYETDRTETLCYEDEYSGIYNMVTEYRHYLASMFSPIDRAFLIQRNIQNARNHWGEDDSRMMNGTHVEKCVIKQFTWIPNELHQADVVIYTMTDRLENPKGWLKRTREIVRPSGLLIIFSGGQFHQNNLTHFIGEDFELMKSDTLHAIEFCRSDIYPKSTATVTCWKKIA
ncbi:unnamed protein product [Didymodactylos carnosus]|uniref:Sulfatase-modifying factor enzyme domain-containing protein n=1 Tax=Didymodactylos carnosus TaxID=1234261 RepID=A0A8S2D857_9BILA|nr:unnamed protein product [Didymodactylos carnosus]CAF3618312.1 unnamed protein product [Didymodactylos carnosus]